MKTPEEIRDLKTDWLYDPCYDIEETEGFEDHKEELLAFRKTAEAKWEFNRITRLTQMSIGMGLEDNLKLVAFLEMLENRIIKLEENFNQLISL